MSADGEIEIAVKAEGAEDAAAELGDGGGPSVAGGGGGGDGSASGRLTRAGSLAGFALALLGPLKDVLDPILKILNAFLAPIAIIALRLLQPLLRFLIQRLPFVFRVMEGILFVIDTVRSIIGRVRAILWDKLTSLAGDIWTKIKNGASWLVNGASKIGEAVWNATTTTLGDITDGVGDLPRQIWEYMKQLPGQIGQAISSRVPGLGGGDGDGFSLPFGPFDGGDGGDGGGGGGGGPFGIFGNVGVDVDFDGPEFISFRQRDQNTEGA